MDILVEKINRAAVVDLADHESPDQSQQGVSWQRTPYAPDLSKCRKAQPGDSSDVSLHGDVGVEVDTPIPD